MASTDWTTARQQVPLSEWLRVTREECLDEYLPAGGAAVRFVSGSPAALEGARDGVLAAGREAGCHVAALDPGQLTDEGKSPALHQIHHFFFAVTAEVEWKQWAAVQAREFLRGQGLHIAPERSLLELEAIAEENGRDHSDLLQEYQARVATRQIKDRAMEYEFRSAITALGRAQLIPDAVTPTTEEVLLAWLCGRTMPGASAALKKIQIYQRIGVTNARHMLRSFCRWLPRVDRTGLVVVLDFRPYESKRRGGVEQRLSQQKLLEAVFGGDSVDELRPQYEDLNRAPAVSYSNPAYRTMLALLRRFIDDLDQFERFLLVVLTTPGFYDVESPRHYGNYDALQGRIGLEVRDAARANPSAALVHLGDPA